MKIQLMLKAEASTPAVIRNKWYVVDETSSKSAIVKGPFNTRKEAESKKKPDGRSGVIYQSVMNGQQCLDEGIKHGASATTKGETSLVSDVEAALKKHKGLEVVRIAGPMGAGDVSVTASFIDGPTVVSALFTIVPGKGRKYTLKNLELMAKANGVETAWRRPRPATSEGTLTQLSKVVVEACKARAAKKIRAPSGDNSGGGGVAKQPTSKAAVSKEVKRLEKERDTLVANYNEKIKKLRDGMK